MNTIQMSIVHRLPQSYRWVVGFTDLKVEPIPPNGPLGEEALVGFKLLSPVGENAALIMVSLSQVLIDIGVYSAVVEYQGEPCLFVHLQDEPAATCRLKNVGVAIAESFSSDNAFGIQTDARS